MGEVMVKERPILFSGEMVRAILDHGKTQTRRLIKATGEKPMSAVAKWRVGDRFWVRETWYQNQVTGDYLYRADRADPTQPPIVAPIADVIRARWKPSIFMPHEACRLELNIEAVRVERVQTLTEADALAEGVYQVDRSWTWNGVMQFNSPVEAYCHLWNKINPEAKWRTNPFVSVITFKRREVG